MADNIRGLTVEIGADASSFNKEMSSMRKAAQASQTELNALQKSLELKFDADKFARAQKVAQQAIDQTAANAVADNQTAERADAGNQRQNSQTKDGASVSNQIQDSQTAQEDTGSQVEEVQTQEQNSQTAGAVQNNGGQTDMGLEQAKSVALAHAGIEASAVTFTKGKLDYEDGRQEYEIEFVTADTKYEYEIKADDGAVLKASAEPVEKISGNGQMQGGITLEEAKAAALAYVGVEEGTSSFTKLELDYDDGTAVYEIEFYEDKNGKSENETYHLEEKKKKILEKVRNYGK